MIDIRLTKFKSSEKCSVELVNFEPKGGLEIFIKTLSEYLEEDLLEWSRNWEFGVGTITFMGNKIALIQSEFPQVFSFDCQSEAIANELKKRLVKFFGSDIGRRLIQGPES